MSESEVSASEDDDERTILSEPGDILLVDGKQSVTWLLRHRDPSDYPSELESDADPES